VVDLASVESADTVQACRTRMTNMSSSSRLSTSDKWAVLYLLKSCGNPLDSYYCTIEELVSIVGEKSFTTQMSGYYLNMEPVGPNRHLRVSFFAPDKSADHLVQLIRVSLSSRGVLEVKPAKMPRNIRVVDEYGPPEIELRFRRYLVDYTQIGLDLIRSDLVYARRLMAWLRFKVIAGSLDVRNQIEPSMLGRSQYYQSMSPVERSKFLLDLVTKPNPTAYDWAHFMVNCVLGLNDPTGTRRKYSGNPWPTWAINQELQLQDSSFYLPDDWKPD